MSGAMRAVQRIGAEGSAQSDRVIAGTRLICCEGLHQSYRVGHSTVNVLGGIDLEITDGAFVALVGPSGSGKTTLLYLLSGLMAPTSGTIEVAGQRLSDLSEGARSRFRADNVGFVFQSYNLLPVLSAIENVMLPLALTRLSRKDRKKRAQVALEVVGMTDRAKHRPTELSGGQQQRVAIARAIVSDPKIIMADEPTGNLDRKSADDVLQLLETLNQELQKTIVMVTHDPNAAARANQQLRLDKGELQ